MDRDHVGQLVRLALDEFDERSLGTSARRAYRIARLRGDVEVAHRLQLELRPTVSAHDRATAVMALYPGQPYEDAQTRHRVELEYFLESRTPSRTAQLGDDDPFKMLYGSVDELAVLLERAERALADAEADGYLDLVTNGIDLVGDRREIFKRIQAYVFDYLVRTETQLEASDTVSQTLVRHRARVDALLEVVAPDIRDQLQAALRAARAGGSEERTHVLTTCRRVIIAVADRLFPPSDEPHIDADGVSHKVGPGQYRNRILAARGGAGTAERAFMSAMDDLTSRLDRLDELTQKGVHAQVSEPEMEFGLAQTYLLVGEMLRVQDETTAV